jgi:hypothetical protein
MSQFTPPASGPEASLAGVLQGSNIGTGVAAFATNYNDLFAALLELSYKEVSFPYVSIRSELRHDLAIHKFVDRDGAYIEGTGRSPLEFTARIPMLNGLDAGINEHWQRPLYPFVRDNLLRVAVDKSSGTLQHPELGPITCKLERMSWVLEAGVRSGVWVDVTWLETDDTGIDLQQALSNPSPLANCQAAANDLTFQIASIDPNLIPQPYVPTIGFDDMMNAIRGVTDTPTILQKQYAGRVDNFIYECNALEASLNSAASALNWPMIQSAERAKQAAYQLKSTLLAKGKAVGLFTVQKTSTLAQVAAQIPAPIGDLIQLNTAFMNHPLVPASSQIRYYLKKAA